MPKKRFRDEQIAFTLRTRALRGEIDAALTLDKYNQSAQ
jgi:hypothetical protein